MRAVSRRPAQPPVPRRARVSGLALLVAASAALVVVPALPASAHNYLVSSAPAAGAVLTEQPGTVSLETNDDLLEVEDGAVIQVRGPDERFYSDGCTAVAGPSAETQVVLGAPGEYTVAWKVVSTDGHPISGTWAFTWQPAEGVELGEGSDEPLACGGGSADDAVVSTPEPSTDATTEGSDAAATSSPLDALWIGGGVLLAAIAAIGTWLVVRRRT
jgi:copper resistance protein C